MWILRVAMSEPQNNSATSCDPNFDALERARAAQDGIARKHQSRRKGLALVLLALSVIAVLCGAMQGAWFPLEGHTESQKFIAVGLILVEMLVLAGMLVLDRVKYAEAKHQEWVGARLRAELLRREGFLYRARVGPYLARSDLGQRVADRISQISTSKDLLSHLSLRGEHATWQDELEDERHRGEETQPPVGADLNQSFSFYRQQRIADQQGYFDAKARQFQRLDFRLKVVAKTVVTLALLMSTAHFSLLWAEQQLAPLAFLAHFLPALSGAMIAWRETVQSKRLKMTYRRKSSQLEELQRDFRRLTENPSPFFFKRLVLRTETVLSQDLYEWWLVMNPVTPEGDH